MESNRINLFNDLKRTNIVGGRPPRQGHGKLEMINKLILSSIGRHVHYKSLSKGF